MYIYMYVYIYIYIYRSIVSVSNFYIYHSVHYIYYTFPLVIVLTKCTNASALQGTVRQKFDIWVPRLPH